jgi:hypothetical protein
VEAIIKYFKKRLANAQIKARLLAVVAFVVFAYLGVNDVTDLAKTLANPDASVKTLAQTYSVTDIPVSTVTTRAVVLMLFSVIITLASLATVVGAMQRTTLLRGWIVVTVTYAVYALVQIAIAVLMFNNPLAAVPSLAYLLLAAAAYSFGRQASRALDPVIH